MNIFERGHTVSHRQEKLHVTLQMWILAVCVYVRALELRVNQQLRAHV